MASKGGPPSAEAELHRAVDLLYRTCTEPAVWPDALAAAARPLGASGGCAFWADGADPSAATVWLRQHGLDPGAVDLYLREYTRADPWLNALREPCHREGRAVTGAALVDPASLRRTRFGAELLPRLGVGRLLTGFAVREGTRQAILGFVRPEQAPEFAAVEERRWGLLQRHARRAIWLRERLALAGGARRRRRALASGNAARGRRQGRGRGGAADRRGGVA